MAEFKLPTETILLPSQGKIYSNDNPLSLGKVEIKYMTAREEDILTNQNYIRQGTVIDKLLQSLIETKINYDDLLIGDKNAIMMAARILAYGGNYEFEYDGVSQNIDLSLIEPKPIHPDYENAVRNEFTYTLPYSKNEIKFKLLTHGDEIKIEKEIKGLQKINKDTQNEVTSRLSQMIISINGLTERKDINDFVNNYFLAKDVREFRKYYSELTPDLNFKISLFNSNGVEEDTNLPIGLNFFWPDI